MRVLIATPALLWDLQCNANLSQQKGGAIDQLLLLFDYLLFATAFRTEFVIHRMNRTTTTAMNR
jgi:hypothetical protein